MYSYNQRNSKVADASKHKDNVTKAAMLYIEVDSMTLDRLSRAFKVSGNTINTWLCEAIANNYVPNTTLCKKLINKHLTEYENKHNIKSSCLRQMYEAAIASRNANLPVSV